MRALVSDRRETSGTIRERDIPVAATSKIAASAIRATLTDRELQIFQLLASGENNQEIGRELSLNPHTVSNHIKSILAKLSSTTASRQRSTRSGAESPYQHPVYETETATFAIATGGVG